MLSDKDLANVTNRLQVPLIVQDILNGQGDLTDDIRLGLHEVLSDFEPDSALLSIALSARKIAGRYQHKAASLAVLKMECDRVIADYAELWHKNATQRPMDDNLVFDTLMNIPEDLEALAELMNVCAPFIARASKESAELLDIMAIQAEAQALIAETFVEMLDFAESNDDMANDNGLVSIETLAAESNVIPFPLRAS